MADKQITSVAAGDSHSLALTSDGRCVYGWGNCCYGQLGLGLGYHGKSFHVPTPIPILGGEEIIRIGAGRDHSIAITITAEIYIWGAKDATSFPRGDNTYFPTRLPLAPLLRVNGNVSPVPLRVVQAVCGWDTTMILAELPQGVELEDE